MRRREFIAGIGAVGASPLVGRAQQPPMKVLGYLFTGEAPTERNSTPRNGEDYANALKAQGFRNFAAFYEAIAKLGWIEGRNLRIDVRAGASDPNRIRAAAAELVGLAPDAVVTQTLAATRAMQQQTKSIPIIFTGGGDPVASRIVQSIARPEGNTTGFPNLFFSISGKWMELLKEAAPHIARVAFIFNPAANSTPPRAYITQAEVAAPALAVQLIQMPVRNDLELMRAFDAFGGEQNSGLILLTPEVNLDLLIGLAKQNRMPGMFADRVFVVRRGGLMSYGSIAADLYRGAASYVDRILRGAKPSELPVQFPTKFELVLNLKTANAIGLVIPPALIARADEVIE